MNNFKIPLRVLWRNKGFSLINIVGFSIALTIVLILYLFISYELSFDNYHPDFKNSYRIIYEKDRAGGKEMDSSPPFPLHRKLRENVPGITNVGQIFFNDKANFFTNEKAFQENGLTFIDSAFFNYILVEFITGTKEVIDNPGNAIITEELAKKFYGDENPLGKILEINGQLQFQVAAIIKSPRNNTHLPFSILVNLENLSEDFVNFEYDSWGSAKTGFCTFIKKDINSTIPEIEDRIDNIFYANSKNPEKEYDFILEPFNRIHLSKTGPFEGSYNTPTQVIWTFFSVGIFILILAVINFVNLSTIQSFKRSKEVGIKKTLGSSRGQLLKQYLYEATLLIFISEVIAVIITEMLLPKVNSFIGGNIELGLYNNLSVFIFLIGILILVSLLSGIYPAYSISSFNPLNSIRTNKLSNNLRKLSLYKAFVIFQFFIAQFLIIGVVVMFQQLNHLNNRELGFESKNILLTSLPDVSENAKLDFKKKVLALPEVITASCQAAPPLFGHNYTSNFRIDKRNIDEYTGLKIVDDTYNSVYGLKLSAGKWFNENMLHDSIKKTIVNKKFVQLAGFDNDEEAIGEIFYAMGFYHECIGVIEDIETTNARRQSGATLFYFDDSWLFYLGIKYQEGTEKLLLQKLQTLWELTFPQSPLEYSYFEENLKTHYEYEHKIMKILSGFSFLTIVISILGFFGLVSYLVNQKIKDIAIRKTFGAKTSDINYRLSLQFIKLIIVGGILAWPFCYLLMERWLQRYVYRIELNIFIFFIATIFLAMLALIMISQQVFRAANTNPANSLRQE